MGVPGSARLCRPACLNQLQLLQSYAYGFQVLVVVFGKGSVSHLNPKSLIKEKRGPALKTHPLGTPSTSSAARPPAEVNRYARKGAAGGWISRGFGADQ